MAKLHLLLSPEFYEGMPSFIEVTSFAHILVIFESGVVEGDNSFISYPEERREEVKKWLAQHKKIYLGNNIPMTEEFQIMHPEDIKGAI